MAFTKQDVLARRAFKVHPVTIGDFGSAFMRELSVAQSVALGKRVDAGDAESNIRDVLQIVVAALVNEDGTPMFTAAETPEAIDALMAMSLKECKVLIDACLAVNGLTKDAIKEELGNSEAVQS